LTLFSHLIYIFFFRFVIVVDFVLKILPVETEEEPEEARRIKICVHDKERG